MNTTTLTDAQFDERATPAKKLCIIIQIDHDVEDGWK